MTDSNEDILSKRIMYYSNCIKSMLTASFSIDYKIVYCYAFENYICVCMYMHIHFLWKIIIINRLNKTRSLLLDKYDRCHSDRHYRIPFNKHI